MLGSANIEGGDAFHVLSGNLSHQIEHHLYPDIPAHRYADIAVEVRALCEEYDLPYESGPLHTQLGQVWRKILRLSLPEDGVGGLVERAARAVREPSRITDRLRDTVAGTKRLVASIGG